MIHKILKAFIWMFILDYLFNFHGAFGLQYSYPGFGWFVLAVVILSPISICLWRWKAVGFWVSLFFWPLWLLYKIIKLVFRGLKPIITAVKGSIRVGGWLYRSLPSKVFSSTVLVICWMAVCRTSAGILLEVELYMLGILLLLFLFSFHFALTNPLFYLEAISNSIIGAYNWLINLSHQPLKRKDGSIEKSNDEPPHLSRTVLFTAYKIFGWLTEFVKKKSDRESLVMAFTFLFLFAFTLTILSFGFLYWGLYRTDSRSFTSYDNPPFGEFLYFSLTTMATIDNEDIVPASFWAKAIVSFEIVVGVYLLIIIIVAFTTIGEPKRQETVEDILGRIQSTMQSVRKEAKEGLGVEDLDSEVRQFWDGLKRLPGKDKDSAPKELEDMTNQTDATTTD